MPETLAALGLKLQIVIAGGVGAFISLRFFEGLSIYERWGTVLGGWGMSAYGTGYAIEALELKSQAAETCFALLIGLFGMSLAAAGIKVIRDIDWVGIVKGLLDRFSGGGTTGGSK